MNIKYISNSSYQGVVKRLMSDLPAARHLFIPDNDEYLSMDRGPIGLYDYKSAYSCVEYATNKAYAEAHGWDFASWKAFDVLRQSDDPRMQLFFKYGPKDPNQIRDYRVMKHGSDESFTTVVGSLRDQVFESAPPVLKAVDYCIQKYPEASKGRLSYTQECLQSIADEYEQLNREYPLLEVVQARLPEALTDKDVLRSYEWATTHVYGFNVKLDIADRVKQYSEKNDVSLYKAWSMANYLSNSGRELPKATCQPLSLVERLMIQDFKKGVLEEGDAFDGVSHVDSFTPKPKDGDSSKPRRAPRDNYKSREAKFDSVVKDLEEKIDSKFDSVVKDLEAKLKAGIPKNNDAQVVDTKPITRKQKGPRKAPKEKPYIQKISNEDFVELILSEPDLADVVNTRTKTPTYNVALQAKANDYNIPCGVPMRRKMETSVKRTPELMAKMEDFVKARELERATGDLELFTENSKNFL